MNIYLETLGCRLNEAEIESWSDDFRDKGHHITHTIEQADLIVINSCAVTKEAVRKSRQLIRRNRRLNSTARLVISGCYASLNPDEIIELTDSTEIIHNTDKDQLPEFISPDVEIPSQRIEVQIPTTQEFPKRRRQRAFIKVQDGCRYQCSYCIITLARGEERSKSIQDVLKEIKDYEQQGRKEAIIAGVHLGGYGSDHNTNLVELIEQILEKTAIQRLRLGSLEPWDISDNFWKLFKNKRLMPHVHLPLQSGCDAVLKRMSRRCKTAEFKAHFEQGRNLVPNLNITTDIIVGFPGETQDHWQQTLDYLKQFDFGHIHIFPFSPHPATKAFRLTGALSNEIKKVRVKTLEQQAMTSRLEFLNKQRGKNMAVLIESHQNQYYFGYTENYLRLAIKSDQILKINSIIKARVIEVDQSRNCLVGILQ